MTADYVIVVDGKTYLVPCDLIRTWHEQGKLTINDRREITNLPDLIRALPDECKRDVHLKSFVR